MLLDPDTESDVAYELCQLLGRAILPIRVGGRDHGTTFFFRAVAGDREREYLLTADALTRARRGEIGLRPSVTEPAGVAGDALVLPDLAAAWVHRPDLGAAIMPAADLHAHAAGEGWRWRTQQVPDAVAADAGTIARLGAEPGSAIVLALGVGADGARPLEVAIERVVREGDSAIVLALGVGADGARPLEVAIERVVREGDTVRITTGLPAGYVGAPVFGVQAGGEGEVGLRCLGLVLPGDADGHPVATFDGIRAALATLPDGA